VAKGGEGVWWVQYVAVNGIPGGAWPNAPAVSAGVLRLGDPGGPTWPPNPHTMPAGQSLSLAVDAGVGIAWETLVNLPANVPFAVSPGSANVGQAGALDIDLWNFGGTLPVAPPTINTNTLTATGQWTYLRVGSSMGGDASFDPQPQPGKHASVAYQTVQGALTQIMPSMVPGQAHPLYYFGGGGGTLRIDSQLQNYQPRAALEMGTTGKLLPGRVALNPGPETNPEAANLYTGRTQVLAGTLQLMKRNAVYATSGVNVGSYDADILQGLYKTPWYPNATWEGPGQLLLDPGRNPQGTGPKDWDLTWYSAGGNFANPLLNFLSLNGGVIGWTADVDLPAVPGKYFAPMMSDLTGVQQMVYVLGLGGEYSAGSMYVKFPITETLGETITPVLLYKAGKNSVLDLRQMPFPLLPPNQRWFTGGTIIAGGTVLIDSAAQLNAETDGAGGPLAILNGGRLRVAQALQGPPTVDLYVPVKINTAGTPQVTKNCGSVIEVDPNVRFRLMRPFDFSWNPTAYLEKEGDGFLYYEPLVAPNTGTANAWGLKLTKGTTVVNQMPVNRSPAGASGDTGPAIFNGGHLTVHQVPAGAGVLDSDPGYGFRALVSMQGTSSDVWVGDNAMFRTHGWAPNEILGEVHFQASSSDGTAANNVVHLSRNMAPQPLSLPADYSRGDGRLIFEGVTVYMSGGGFVGVPGKNGPLNVLPREAGFVLTLGDGVAFHGSHQNPVRGEVNFNNTDPTRPVQINGAEAIPPTPAAPPPYYQFALADNEWLIEGTGYTTWSKRTEKIGTGTVKFYRQQGAPVSLGSGATLAILNGKLVARGTADPFTDTVTGKSLTITNDATNPALGYGLRIEEGSKFVASISGVGDTYVTGAGTVLTTSSIVQNTLTIGAGSAVVIAPVPAAAGAAAVPEPGAWVLLAVGAACLWPLLRRRAD
jgi:hypothetical protein